MTIDEPITLGEAARLIGRSENRVGQLERAGYIKKIKHGKYDAADVCQGFARSVQDDKRTTEKSLADAALAQARADATHLRIERERGVLVPTHAAVEYLKLVSGIIVRELVGLPTAFTRDLAQRKRLESMLDAVRHRVADEIESGGDELLEVAMRAGKRK
jgi:phage terminase Nu1 subunit (DNA packaging protein)